MSLSRSSDLRVALIATLSILAFVGLSGSIRAAGGVVTSVSGESDEDGDTEQRAPLAPGQVIAMKGDSTASVLMGDNALFNLCNGASLSFRPGPANVIDLTQGGLKAAVQPGTLTDPMQIHTPTAIATLVGTVAYLAVDPITGDTVVTSLEHEVRVTNRDPAVPGEVVLSPGEQVEVTSGEEPGVMRQIDTKALGESSPCLNDGDFRLSAVAKDRREFEFAMIDTIPAMDIPEGLEPVSSGPSGPFGDINTGSVATASCIPSTGCRANDPVAGTPAVSGPSPPVGPPPIP